MVLLVYSSSLGLLAYLTKVLLLYAAVQGRESFVSRDGETTLNYLGGFLSISPSPGNYKFTLQPVTEEMGRVYILQGCCLTNISGAQKGKSQNVRSPTGNVLGTAAKI